ncbi:MAG: hypothetical protein AAF216_10100 [Pseudomonadota bacterium]
MAVSTRNTLLAGLAALSLMAIGGVAVAGGPMDGGSPCGASGCGTPAMPTTPPGTMPGGSPGCCGNLPKGTNIILPGVSVAGPNIAVGGTHVGVKQGNIMFGGSNTIITNNSVVGSSSDGMTFISGGGAYFAPQSVAGSSIAGLTVNGAEERYTETVTERVPVREEICPPRLVQRTSIRPVQAVCLDDTGTPHPASQVSNAREIGSDYNGEIYRCVAGTSMQVTLGRVHEGQADFTQAQSFQCQKGEALVRRADGELTCAAQIPQRDCNERSLLRQHGPGIKLIESKVTEQTCVPQTVTRMQSVSRQVERVRPTTSTGNIVLDGGVGQGVF